MSKNLKATNALVLKARSAYLKAEGALSSARLGAAKDLYDEALKIFRKLGDSQDEGQCLLKVGRALELMGQYDQARVSYEQALVLFQKVRDRMDLARSKAFLGNV